MRSLTIKLSNDINNLEPQRYVASEQQNEPAGVTPRLYYVGGTDQRATGYAGSWLRKRGRSTDLQAVPSTGSVGARAFYLYKTYLFLTYTCKKPVHRV